MKKNLPLIAFELYWVFTLVLYALGPFAWVTYQATLFWFFNIAFLVAFAIGWILGDRVIVLNNPIQWDDEAEKHLVRQICPMIYINLLYEFINLFRTYHFSNFDLKGLIQRLLIGLSDMGTAYNSFQEGLADSVTVAGGTIVTIFNRIWEVWAFSILLLSMLLFKRLKLHQKIVVLITILIVVVAYLARGTNIGVFRIALAIVVFSFVLNIKVKTDNNSIRMHKGRVIIIGIAAVLVVILLFDKIMKSRGGINSWNSSAYNVGGVFLDPNSVFFKIVPAPFHQLLVSLSGYLTQGYYGMSLSLRVPWEPMFGTGFSMGIQNLLERILPGVISNSYQARIEQFGWDRDIRWHSMYSWIANDLSYWGVIPIMMIYGYLFKRSMHDSVELNNPYAKVMLYFMFLIAVFVPCNNQIAQSTYTLWAFVYIFIKWQLSKRNVIIKLK